MGLLTQVTDFRRIDMAVDLGTTNTVVYVSGRGIKVCEPTVAAVDSSTGDVRAVGTEAQRLLEAEEAEGEVIELRPVRGGAIADLSVAEKMLEQFIAKARRGLWAHAGSVIVGVPSGDTYVHRRAAREAVLSAGARRAWLIEDPLAAATGAGLPVGENVASLVVDIGGGTTESAVISLGDIVVSRSIAVGGDELDRAVARHLYHQRGLSVSPQTAEQVKREIGSAYPPGVDRQAEVDGHDTRTGEVRTVVVDGGEIRQALEYPIAKIVDSVMDTLSHTPPTLCSDLIDRGAILAGGGSLLPGLTDRIREETKMPAELSELPLTCVATGAGAWLEELRATGAHRSPEQYKQGPITADAR